VNELEMGTSLARFIPAVLFQKPDDLSTVHDNPADSCQYDTSMCINTHH
jgi:hypothetical protein